MNDRAREGRLLGYIDNGCRIWDKEKGEVIKASDVRFIEEKLNQPKMMYFQDEEVGDEEYVPPREETSKSRNMGGKDKKHIAEDNENNEDSFHPEMKRRERRKKPKTMETTRF